MLFKIIVDYYPRLIIRIFPSEIRNLLYIIFVICSNSSILHPWNESGMKASITSFPIIFFFPSERDVEMKISISF